MTTLQIACLIASWPVLGLATLLYMCRLEHTKPTGLDLFSGFIIGYIVIFIAVWWTIQEGKNSTKKALDNC
jgi:hypothetical protein